MRGHGSPPRARQDALLLETLGEELIIYDQCSHTAHCLSPIAARVWRHCDGEHNLSELVEFAGASENLVADALYEMREKNLLDASAALTPNNSGISRREAIVRGARVGGAVVVVPLIASATAATPAMATSFTGKPVNITPDPAIYKKAEKKVITIANNTGEALTITKVTLLSEFSFKLENDKCSSVMLNASGLGSTCTVEVDLPTFTTGLFTHLKVTTPDGPEESDVESK